MEKELKWAVLGTGIIANEMAQALEKWGKDRMLWQTEHMRKPKNC